MGLEKEVKSRSWIKAQLQSVLEKQVEVVMVRGEPIYGRLVAFSLDTKPAMIVVSSNSNKLFINLERVERIRVAE